MAKNRKKANGRIDKNKKHMVIPPEFLKEKELSSGKEGLLSYNKKPKIHQKPIIVAVKDVKVVTNKPVEEVTLDGKVIKDDRKEEVKLSNRTMAGAVGSGLEENMEEHEEAVKDGTYKPSGDAEHPDNPDPADIVDGKAKGAAEPKETPDPYKIYEYEHTDDSGMVGAIASGLEGNIIQHDEAVEDGTYKAKDDAEHPDNRDPADIVDGKAKGAPAPKDGKLEEMIDLKKTPMPDPEKGAEGPNKAGRIASGLDGNIQEYEEEVKKGTYKPSGDAEHPDNPDPSDIVDGKAKGAPEPKDVKNPFEIDHFEHTDDPDMAGAIGSGLASNMKEAEEAKSKS